MNQQLRQQIDQAKSKPLSDADIMSAIFNKANLVLYSDIKNYKNIDSLLGKHKCCVVLYEGDSETGHWCCILRNRNGELEFFDPYGVKLDDEIKWNKNNKYPKELTELILKNNEPIIYNDQKLQKLSPDISTCGRHIISRILLRKMDLDTYCDMLRSFKKKGFDSDDIVTLLTIDI